jgi:Na+/H+ antiporter NhaA
LTALAVIDDLGAILVIAFTQNYFMLNLGIALGLCCFFYTESHERYIPLFTLIGVGIIVVVFMLNWYSCYCTGVLLAL